MIDGQRRYPVDLLTLHHAVSDNMTNWDDLRVQDWFSQVGKARGYQNGAINPRHEHPSRNGELTYSMAQFNLRPYTADGNKYGWRLTELMKRPFDNVAWHAGVWEVNQRSLGIEVSGNYVDKKLPRKALMLIADSFRQHDKNTGGALNVVYHAQFFATACPGLIREQINEIVDMINNPAKWNEILWPNPTKPVPDPTKLENGALVLHPKNDSVKLWDLTTNPDYKAVKNFTRGETIDVTHFIDFNNTKYYLTQYSVNEGKKNGINIADVYVQRKETKEEVLPYETVVIEDPKLPEGDTQVSVYGENGAIKITYIVLTDNGSEVSREETGREIIKQPIDQIVHVGTGKEGSYPSWFVEFWNKVIEFIQGLIGGKK